MSPELLNLDSDEEEGQPEVDDAARRTTTFVQGNRVQIKSVPQSPKRDTQRGIEATNRHSIRMSTSPSSPAMVRTTTRLSNTPPPRMVAFTESSQQKGGGGGHRQSIQSSLDDGYSSSEDSFDREMREEDERNGISRRLEKVRVCKERSDEALRVPRDMVRQRHEQLLLWRLASLVAVALLTSKRSARRSEFPAGANKS